VLKRFGDLAIEENKKLRARRARREGEAKKGETQKEDRADKAREDAEARR